jgi:hypothetical protein
MDIRTYSFGDIHGVIAHPTFGSFDLVGKSIGNGGINIEALTDKSVHNVSADGRVMISKIAGDNASMTIRVQQDSNFHKFLLGLYNYLNASDASLWAQAASTFRAPTLGETNILQGVTFQKRAGQPYESQAQMVSWAFLVADWQLLTV